MTPSPQELALRAVVRLALGGAIIGCGGRVAPTACDSPAPTPAADAEPAKDVEQEAGAEPPVLDEYCVVLLSSAAETGSVRAIESFDHARCCETLVRAGDPLKTAWSSGCCHHPISDDPQNVCTAWGPPVPPRVTAAILEALLS